MITWITGIVWFSFLVSLYFVTFWLLVFLERGLFENAEESPDFPLVTIAIPAYNEEETIIPTLDSVLALDYPQEKLQIIVVNDGSTDQTKILVEGYAKERANIQLINQKNQGKGTALNNALRNAIGEYFTCLDADSCISSNALKRMLPRFQKDEKVAAVLPLMKVKNPHGFLGRLQWCEYLINLFYKSIMGKLDCIHVAPGPFSVYKKAILEQLGGFAEHNLTEDLEVSLKLQKNHYKIVQVLNAEVYTMTPSTLKAFYKQRNRWYKGTMLNLFNYKNMIFNRKYGDFGVLQLPRVFIAGFLAVTMILLFSYQFILKPITKWVYDLSFVNFDILYFIRSWLSNLLANFAIIDLNISNLFFGATAITLSLIVVYLAHRFTRENVREHGILTVPIYLLLYGMLASIVWLGVFIDLAFRKKQKW
ncbi:glycosyltransferase [Candidatus Woesearchaeota archaeon]|nr:glycosyltransferase [Candidatus Woesearchaeota archaeon]